MTATSTALKPGDDLRRRELRREVFQRFYTFHLRYRSHPGGVYYALPHLAETYEWTAEERAWAAFLNGNTQNPVTTLLLMRQGSTPDRAEDVLRFWREHYANLTWDTDRRYHKARLDQAVAGYLFMTKNGRDQVGMWRRASEQGWAGVWRRANAIPTLGRLSAWSYLEYLRLLDVGDVPDSDTLLLHDLDGSRSHRNGLALVTGHDDLIWWDYNPSFNGDYTRDHIEMLATEGEDLLTEARRRNPGHPHVGYLTLESALCTYKGWHRPRRRYPNVYNDLLHDRLLKAETSFGQVFDPLWEARRQHLPPHLRLEDTPTDPGCVPVKQDWYRTTGQVPMMGHDWPEMWSDFDTGVQQGHFGTRTPRATT